MMHWMILPYKRYFEFTGRSRRMEFWMFQLFQIIIVTILLVMMAASFDYVTGEPGTGFLMAIGLYVLFGLISFIPSLSVSVRRLHDQDKSGWMILLGLIPIANFVLLVFYFFDGTHGDNQYGPDPKDPANAHVFE